MAIDAVPEIDQLAVLKNRYSDATKFEIKLKKLNAALVSLSLAERPRQLRRLLQAKEYVEILSKEAPQGFSPLLKIISNEITSLREGIFAGVVKPTDLVLTSGVEAIDKVKTLRAGIANKIKASEEPTESLDATEQMIIKNRAYKEKIPSVEGKHCVVARVPVAFSVSYSRNQSSIGYLNMDKLAHAGFKAESLDGYAVIHNQLSIGVNAKELESYPQIKERTLVHKAGEPTYVVKKRAATVLDLAKDVKKQIEAQTKQKWEFVSDKSYRYEGAHWYWLLPAKDVARLASVFPGGHLKLQSWGFAF
jgi:hypothetical protein